MALTVIPPVVLLPSVRGVATFAAPSTGHRLNAGNAKMAYILRVPHAGNLRTVGFNLGTVTSAPSSNHDVRIETVSASTGLSTGTLWGTNTSGSILLNATGWKTVTLTADATVAVGDYIAIVIQAPGANFGDVRPGTADDSAAYPVDGGSNYYESAAALRLPTSEPVVLIYDDGLVYPSGFWPYTSATEVTYNSGSTPDRRGVRFRLPVPARLCGIQLLLDPDGPCDIVFYDSDGTSATVVASLTTGPRSGVQDVVFSLRWTGIALAANTWYRIAVVPTSGTSLSLWTQTVQASGYLRALANTADVMLTTCGGSPAAEGDWTQDDTSMLPMTLLIDQVDDGSGGGGGGGAVETGFATVGG